MSLSSNMSEPYSYQYTTRHVKWELPGITDPRILSFCDLINSLPIRIKISPRPMCREYQCHKNVIDYVDTYGGLRVLGYHFIEYNNNLIGVLHSIWKNTYDMLDDITASEHGFAHRVFVEINSTTTKKLPPAIYSSSNALTIKS